MNSETDTAVASDDGILLELVRLREHWRAAVGSFGAALRFAPRVGPGSAAGQTEGFRQAGGKLDRIRDCLRALPPKPDAALRDPGRREHGRRLLREIGDLAERAAVIEREARENARPASLRIGPDNGQHERTLIHAGY
jgi:hypothetical protein